MVVMGNVKGRGGGKEGAPIVVAIGSAKKKESAILESERPGLENPP